MSRIGMCELKEEGIGLAAIDDMGLGALRAYRKWMGPAATVGGGVWIGGKFYPNKRKKEMQESGAFDPRRGSVVLDHIIGGVKKAKDAFSNAASKTAQTVRNAPEAFHKSAANTRTRLGKWWSGGVSPEEIATKRQRRAEFPGKVWKGVKHVGGYAGLTAMGGLAAAGSAASHDPYEESERSIVKRSILKESLS